MADERTSRSTPPHDTDGPEVEGHSRRLSRATEQPQPGDEPDVEGHSRRHATPETDQEAEVEGHAGRMLTRATGQPDGDEPEERNIR